MDESMGYYMNPWADDDRALGCLKNVLLLAERTGNLKRDREEEEEMLESSRNRTSSLRMIALLQDIQHKKEQIQQMNMDFQRRVQDKETKDLMHTDVLEKKIAVVNDLNGHIQRLVSHKDQLISRLQQPFVGDFMKLEAKYQRYASELFPQLVPVLAELTSQLDNIDWANKVNLSDPTLELLLTDISTTLATLQSSFQSVSHLRTTTQQLHNQCTSPKH